MSSNSILKFCYYKPLLFLFPETPSLSLNLKPAAKPQTQIVFEGPIIYLNNEQDFFFH